MDQRIKWLLNGDVAIQYLTHFYLLDSLPEICSTLQAGIETEGVGARLLACRNPSGHWRQWFNQPKWTCTHYTLADLKEIGMPPHAEVCREMVIRAFDECGLDNGGINFAKTMVQSDVAVDGMILNYAACFCPDENRVDDQAGYILRQGKSDGGHSWDTASPYCDSHTTLCVREGFAQW